MPFVLNLTTNIPMQIGHGRFDVYPRTTRASCRNSSTITLNQTLTATVPRDEYTWCHHPSGMKIASGVRFEEWNDP